MFRQLLGNLLPGISIIACAMFTSGTAQSQTIWLEDFTDLSNGTTSDAGATGWTRDVSACNLASGYFSVQSNRMVANDTDGEAVWMSEWIDISAQSSVLIGLDVSGAGSLDAGGSNADYFSAYYSVDGGAEIEITNQAGAISNGSPSSCGDVAGDSIQIIVRVHNTGADEFYRFDNVTLSAQSGTAPTANTLYAIASDDWSNGNTWSTTPGGASCGCTPSSTSDVRIQCGYTVNMDSDGEANMVTIYNGSALEWTSNNVELEIYGNGAVTVQSGARMDQAGRSAAELHFIGTGTHTLSVEDVATGVDLDAIEVDGASSLSIDGAGTITLDDDFDLDAACTVTNDLTGSFTIADNIDFDAASSTFINNESITVGDNIDLNNANNVTITNNGTFTIGGDIDMNNSDDVTLTNSATGSIFVQGDDIELSNNSDRVRFNNYGLIEVDDDIKESPAGANAAEIYNYAGATLRLGHNDNDMNFEIYADFDANIVEYFRNGTQDKIFTPQDAYWHLTLSNNGRKRTISNLDINGDVTIVDNASFDVDNGNNNITVAGNWDNTSTAGDPFDQGTETVTFDGTGSHTISATGGEEFYNMIVNKSGGDITLLSDANIVAGGTLTMTDGILYSSTANMMQIQDNAFASTGTTTSYVDGPMAKIGNDAFTFPLGDGSVWAPLRMSSISGFSTSDEYHAEYTFTAAPNGSNLQVGVNNVSTIEYWNVEQIVGSGSADVSLYWNDASRSVITDLTDLIVVRYNTGSTLWEDQSGSVTGGSTVGPGGTGSIGSNVSNFGLFTFGSTVGNNPLPIELLSFDAAPFKDVVEVNWETASELNNDYFTVERSADGVNFEAVTRVEGAGTTAEMRTYATIDLEPFNGLSYYRLKQTDFDGTSTYSEIKAVYFEAPQPEWTEFDAVEATVFPNPANQSDQVFLKLETVEQSEKVLVVVQDMVGNLLYSKVVITQESGDTVVALDPSNQLSAGSYVITGTTQDRIFNKKLIVR